MNIENLHTPLTTEISAYQSQNTKAPKTIHLQKFCDAVVNGIYEDDDYRPLIAKLRTYQKGTSEYSKIKEGLPSFSIQARFAKHSKLISDIEEMTGLLVLDYDADKLEKQEDVDYLYNKVIQDSFVFFAAKSVGGRGFFLIVPYTPFKTWKKDKFSENFKTVYSRLIYYFEKNYEVSFEQNESNPNRQRQLSYDPNAHLNLEALAFEYADYPLPIPKEVKNKVEFISEAITETDYERVIKEMYDNFNMSWINSYDAWRDFGFSLADFVNENLVSDSFAFDYFVKFSALREEGTKAAEIAKSLEKAQKQWSFFLKKQTAKNKVITFKTILKYASESGISIYDKTQEQVIAYAMAYYSKSEKPLDIAKRFVSEKNEIELPFLKVQKTVESVFNAISQNKIIYFNTKGKDLIFNFLDKYKITYCQISKQYNCVMNGIEQPYNKLIENEIKLDFEFWRNELNLQKTITSKVSVVDAIKSVSTKQINPVKSFFDLSENWESQYAEKPEKEHQKLMQVFKGICDVPDSQFAIIEKYLMKYFVSAIPMWLKDVRKGFAYQSPLNLILKGGIGFGKDYFFNNLLPASFKHLACGISHLNITDFIKTTATNLLALDSECCFTNSILSKRDGKETYKVLLGGASNQKARNLYENESTSFERLSILCSTVNELKNVLPILSEKQNRRAIVIDMKNPIAEKNDIGRLYNSIDKYELWREFYYLYKQGFDFEIVEQSDIVELTNYTDKIFNAQNEDLDVMTEIFERYFEFFTQNEVADFEQKKLDGKLKKADYTMTTTEIINILLQDGSFKLIMQDKSQRTGVVEFGTWLNKKYKKEIASYAKIMHANLARYYVKMRNNMAVSYSSQRDAIEVELNQTKQTHSAIDAIGLVLSKNKLSQDFAKENYDVF